MESDELMESNELKEFLNQKLRESKDGAIKLTSCDIGDEGAQLLAKKLMQNTTITKLWLVNNAIGYEGDEGGKALAKVLMVNTTLDELNLNENSIGNNIAIELAKALETNTTLAKLDLGINQIEYEGATALAEALKVNTTVTKLDLSDNNIGNKGATALAEALKVNISVTKLDLSFSNIGDEGAKAIAEALKVNTTVTKLDLRYNNIRDEGAQALAEALKGNTTVTKLDLRYNEIGDKGAQAIAEALKVNTTVTELDSYNHRITDQQIKTDKTDIKNLLERNKQIKNIKDSLLKGEKIVRTKEDQYSINNTTYDNDVVALAIKTMVKDLEPSDKDSDSERNRKSDVTDGLKKVNNSNHLYTLVRTLNSLDDSGEMIFSDNQKKIFIEEFVKSDFTRSLTTVLLTSKQLQQEYKDGSKITTDKPSCPFLSLPLETISYILYQELPPQIKMIFSNNANDKSDATVKGINDPDIKRFESFITSFINTSQGIQKSDREAGPGNSPTHPDSNEAMSTSKGGVRSCV